MKNLYLIVLLFSSFHLNGQISAKLMRYMDVSDTQITFVYGGDIWLVSKEGGTAIQITHSPGEESWPRFSPDGNFIAYTASYQGNADVFVLSVRGGVPTRVTYQSHADRMVDWHPDGDKILFASRRELGQRGSQQFFLVNKEGGFPVKLKVPYGELASYSPDAKKLAYITKITENYPFKRYQGGLASDVLIYNLRNNTVEKITDHPGNDGKPAWVGNTIYFLSDQGENMRLNIWAYDTKSRSTRQITQFKDFDISFFSAGKKEIVFESGGTLYLMDLANHQYQPVPVNIISDLSVEMPRSQDVRERINNAAASPGGKRIVFEARGELFNAPSKEGYVLNMTQSSGSFDREPAWSPDGKSIAFWSDRSGEFELYIQSSDGDKKVQQLTQRGKGFGYTLYWSPDSKKIAYIDETNDVAVVDVDAKSTKVVNKNLWNIGHGARYGFTISWSPNSKWMTFSNGLENANNVILLYNLEEEKMHQATSGFYNDFNPVFSADGKYLFYLTNRNFSANYSSMGDGTWIYPNSTQIASVSLTKDGGSLLSPKNDELENTKEDKERKGGKEEKDSDEMKEGEKEKKEKGSEADQLNSDKDSSDTGKSLTYDLENIEARLEILPPQAGNIRNIASFKGKLVYLRAPNTGSVERSSTLMFYDLKEREEKTIMKDVSRFTSTGDGKSILVSSHGNYGIIKPAPNQKMDKPVPTDGLVMDLIPKEEWKQIFNDTWRRYRDFFYDPAMHGVDWNALRNQYGALIKDARTRWDITNIQSNLAAELSAGHTYTFGGDVERVTPKYTGYMGVDWEMENDKYRIKQIVRPAVWDTEVRSPFDKPGVEVDEGYYILSVNGVPLDPAKDPYAPFEGLAGKTVSVEVSKTGEEEDTKKVVIKCLTQGEESQLRYLSWIEHNRNLVDKLSDGKLGYVYMSNTGGRGQLELVRMFYGQLDKEGFIIDERFNGGGQLADRFLELITRPVVYNLHWRHGKDHTYPIKTNTGPVGMLINGWAGSGGDGLPWAFQELKAGPIVGERTLGILVGPATGHQLIDQGGITVPGARLYDNDGHWFWEGEGVAPDFKVWDDPNLLVQGRDPQVEKVVDEVLKLLTTQPKKMTPAPPAEDRTAKGLKNN